MTTRAIFLPAAPDAEAWVIVADDAGRVVASAPVSQAPSGAAYTVLVVPGAQALARWVDLPARTEAQARSAAAFLLEDELAAPRGSAHIALGPHQALGRRLVVVADKAAMRGWLQTAADLGVTPDVVIPDHLLLAPPGDGAARIAPLGPMAVVRAADLAVTCEPDLAPLILGDRRVERVEDEQAAQALFAAGVADPIVNLLQGEFAMRAPVKLDAKALRGPVLLALAALAVPVLADGVAFVRHTVAATRAEALTASTAAAIAPEVAAAGGDVRAAALARAAETTATGSGGFLAGAAALFAAVEASPSMQLVSLLYSADGSLRATVRYADLAAVEGLRAALSDRGYLMEEGGSTATDGATLTEITMRPGR